MNYTVAALLGIAAAVALDTLVLRTRLVRRKAFWTAYAIVLVFQLGVNGLLTGLRIVRYDGSRILGLRIVYAPVEDLLFGFAMVTMTLSVWVAAGRRAARTTRPADRAGRPTPDGQAPPGPVR